MLADVRDLCARYGRLRLVEGEAGLLRLSSDDSALLTEVARAEAVTRLLRGRPSPAEATLAAPARGPLKQALIALGWPVEDLAPYEDGDALEIEVRDTLEVRPYQRQAALAWGGRRRRRGGAPVRFWTTGYPLRSPCGSWLHRGTAIASANAVIPIRSVVQNLPFGVDRGGRGMNCMWGVHKLSRPPARLPVGSFCMTAGVCSRGRGHQRRDCRRR